MNAANMSIQNTSEALKRTNNKYDGKSALIDFQKLYLEYSNQIGKSSHLVREIKNRERKEELWVRGSFYAFMSSSAYLFLKRFYLNELIGFFFSFLIYFFQGLSSLFMTVFNFNLADALIDYDGYKQVIASNPLSGNMFEGIFQP